MTLRIAELRLIVRTSFARLLSIWFITNAKAMSSSGEAKATLPPAPGCP